VLLLDEMYVFMYVTYIVS